MKTTTDQSAQVHRLLMTIWIAMFVATAFYYLVCRIRPIQAQDPPTELPTALLGSSLTLIAMAVILKRRILERAAREHSILVLRSAFVISLVFSQVVALFGLMLHFANGWPNSWIFIALGAGSMLLNFPKRSEVEHVLAS